MSIMKTLTTIIFAFILISATTTVANSAKVAKVNVNVDDIDDLTDLLLIERYSF